MRRASRRDANHRAIVQALEQCGCSVLDLSRVGGGCPDLAVAYRGETWMVEIKNPVGYNRLSDDQSEFLDSWHGKTAVVRSVHEAVSIVVGEL